MLLMRHTRGFTLVELVVIISVISILASMLLLGMRETGAKSRDSERQGELRIMQNALDLYKNKYGRYPAGCNGPNTWSAQKVDASTPFDCTSGSFEYIIGLAPEFITTLSVDPKPNGNNSGYHYWVNTDGSVYKLVAFKTVESETVNEFHPFALCDFNDPTNVHGGACVRVQWAGQAEAPNCRLTNSYAIWGGFPVEPRTGVRIDEVRESVICRVPNP
jgi:prepilin-type N-terminal cleavage/methylation domain-containing protein